MSWGYWIWFGGTLFTGRSLRVNLQIWICLGRSNNYRRNKWLNYCVVYSQIIVIADVWQNQQRRFFDCKIGLQNAWVHDQQTFRLFWLNAFTPRSYGKWEMTGHGCKLTNSSRECFLLSVFIVFLSSNDCCNVMGENIEKGQWVPSSIGSGLDVGHNFSRIQVLQVFFYVTRDTRNASKDLRPLQQRHGQAESTIRLFHAIPKLRGPQGHHCISLPQSMFAWWRHAFTVLLPCAWKIGKRVRKFQ